MTLGKPEERLRIWKRGPIWIYVQNINWHLWFHLAVLTRFRRVPKNTPTTFPLEKNCPAKGNYISNSWMEKKDYLKNIRQNFRSDDDFFLALTVNSIDLSKLHLEDMQQEGHLGARLQNGFVDFPPLSGPPTPAHKLFHSHGHHFNPCPFLFPPHPGFCFLYSFLKPQF